MLQHYLRETTALSLGVLLACGPASAANAQAPADPGTPPAGALSTPAPDARGTATASAPQSAESPVAGEGQLGDIIVTAQRRSESLSRVGATVSVIGADELVSQGVDTAADLTRFVPGFQATQSYNGNPVYTLRGVGFNSPNANSTPPVGLYLDEAALPYPYMTLGTVFDLERVEVLKGPQGTLYGRNATGGLINFVSAKPTKEFHAGASAEIGNYDTYNFNGFISGPLADGLTARFAINSQNRNKGWQKSVTRDDRLGELHQNSMRGILALDRGGPFTASFTGSYWKRTGDTVAPQSIRYLPAAGNPLARTSVIARPTSNSQADWVPVESQSQSDIGIIRPAQLIDSRFYSATLKAAYAFSDTVQLASLTSYDNLRHRDATDLGGFQIAANFQDVTGKITSFSQELRLIGTSDNFNWSVGGYYAKDKSRQEQVGYNDQNNTVNTLRGVSATIVQNRFTSQQIARSFGNYDSRSNGDNEVLSGFANADYRFSDQLKLTVGGRYTEDKASQTACTYDYRGGNVAVIDLFYGRIFGKTVDLQPGQCYTLEGASSNFVNGAVQSSQKQHNFAWKANLDFTPTPTTLLYGNISRGYKAGGFPLIAASRSTQFAPIKQEELDRLRTRHQAGPVRPRGATQPQRLLLRLQEQAGLRARRRSGVQHAGPHRQHPEVA